MIHPTSRRAGRRRGNVAIVAILMGTLLGFSALSIDVGLIRVAGTEIQTALDAASFSGVQMLDGTEPGIVAARDMAIQIASENTVLRDRVTVDASTVHVGAYDPVLDTFDAFDAGEDPALVNAVRVAHQPPSFTLGLGSVAFGVSGYTVHARSLALRPRAAGPAGSADCFLPLAIPDCHLASAPPGANPPPMKFTFTPTPTDSVAWASPTINPNSAYLDAQLRDPCAGAPIRVGQPVEVNEGSHTSALQTVADLINGVAPGAGTWDPIYGALPPRDGVLANLPTDSAVTGAAYGRIVEGAVALVDGGGDCSAVDFTGPMQTTGIGWAVIYDVMDTAGAKNLWIQLDVIGQHEIWGEVDEDATGLNVLAPGDPALGLW